MSRGHARTSVCHARTRERGAALVVGLVLLLVMTVLGISSMNTATLEIAQAASSQLQHDAFQQAENAIEIVLAAEHYSTAGPRTVELLDSPDFDRTAVAAYTGVNTGVPGEANSGGVSGAMVAWHFEIEATGFGPDGAVAMHTQGFYVRGRSE